MSIVITKGNSFTGRYTHAVVATANDWVGTASIYSVYPGTAVASVAITAAGTALLFTLPVDSIINLTAGTYTIVGHIVSANLGIDTYKLDTVTVAEVITHTGDMTVVTLTIGKIDGTPAGANTSVLRNVTSQPVTTYVETEVTTTVPDPDNPQMYKATGGVYVASAPVTFTIPTKSFASSTEAWAYANEFLTLRTGDTWNIPAVEDVAVTYTDGTYVASGTKTLDVVGKWSSTAYNGIGGSTVSMIVGFASAAECSAYIEMMLSTSGIDRTSIFSYSYGPYAYGGSTIDVVTVQSVPVTTPGVSQAVVVNAWKGVEVTASISSAFNVGSTVIGVEKISTVTDASGYASFSVIRGSTVTIACAALGKNVTVNTTGLAAVDLSEFF